MIRNIQLFFIFRSPPAMTLSWLEARGLLILYKNLELNKQGCPYKQARQMPHTTDPEIIYYVTEPLCTVFRIATLGFLPQHTKLCVTNGYITYREPGYIQSVQRWSQGETRRDVLSLHCPLVLGLRHLDAFRPVLRSGILNLVLQGLVRFQECYKSDTEVNLEVLRLIRIVQSYLLGDKGTHLSHSYFISHNTTYPKVIDADFIQSIWSTDEVKMMAAQLGLLKDASLFSKDLAQALIANLMSNVDMILEAKGATFLDILKTNYRIVF